MILKWGLLALLLTSPAAAFGHTELFFPRLFSAAELPTTGIVLLNPDPVVATVTFYLFSADGTIVAQNLNQQIPAGGQMARRGSELFPNATIGGWVGVLTDTDGGMQGFWLLYDENMSFLDGAEAAGYDTLGSEQIIPLVAGQTELNVINPNNFALALIITLYGDQGVLATNSSQVAPKFGGLQRQVSTLLPDVDMALARYIRVHTPLQGAAAQFASAAVIRGFLVPTESAVINGVNIAQPATMYFPHIIHGALSGADYTTEIGVTNLSAAGGSVTMTLHREGSTPVSVTRTVAGNGALRETAQNLFGLGDGFVSGWVQVTGFGPLTGFAAYADRVGGGLAVVTPAASQPNLFFSHIANGPPQWQTGLALLNATTDAADVEIVAVAPDGVTRIGSNTFTLQPGFKLARAIHEWIPAARGVNNGFIYLRTTNNVPLYGIELFYTEDLKVLSNVAAGKLAAGLRYTPPPQ